LTDSVLPVPAGPYIQLPNLIYNELVIVIQHLSVNGVITNLDDTPIYSYPYLILLLIYLIVIPSILSSQDSTNDNNWVSL